MSNTDGAAAPSTAPAPAASPSPAPAPAATPAPAAPVPAQPAQPSSGVPGAKASDNSQPDETNFDIPVDFESIVLGPGAAAAQPGGTATTPVAPVAPAAPSPGAAPATTPVAAPAATATAPVPAATPPTAQPAPAPAPSAASEPIGLDNMGQMLIQDRDVLIDKWANELFKLAPEEIDQLQVNAELAIPKIAAKVLFAAMQAIPHQIKQFVPQLISQYNQRNEVTRQATERFFTAFPQIPRKEANKVAEIAQTYLKLNPQLKGDEAIKAVGVMACQMLGYPVVAPAAGPAPMAPFVPAAPTTAAPAMPQVPVTEEDPWSGFDAPN